VESARNSICKERNLQGMDFAKNADYVVSIQFRRQLIRIRDM